MEIKWIGAMIVLGVCGGLGFAQAAAYRRQEASLRQLVYALDYMQCELSYRQTPLPDLCRQTGGQVPGELGAVLVSLARELEDQISPQVSACMAAALGANPGLPQETAQLLERLGATMGRFDLSGQLQGLEGVRQACRMRLDGMAQGRESRLRGYQTLGLCAGASLVILFI